MKMSFNLFVFALIWLLISCFSCAAIIQCIREEREALLQFKQGIQYDGCGLLTSWVGETDCCQWHGIRCDNHTNHVIRLHLVGRNFDYGSSCWMRGNISASLIKLRHLKYLDLSNNYFYSKPIPSFIGSLRSLKYLNLSNSIIQGEIPHQLANLSSLTALDLGYNGFIPVKSLGWLSHLTSLRYIDLSHVDLSEATDWMPVILNLPSLRRIELNRCWPPLSIPSSLVYTNYSTTLQFLSLSYNNINSSGIIQQAFNHSALASNLVYLDLSNNGMSGPIPSVIGSMQSLSYLDLSGNELEWRSPEMLGKLCSLQELDLYNNNITGDLSFIIQTLSQSCVHKSLVYLDMSVNCLWGSIPDEIAAFSWLRTLILSSNQLNGTISPFLGQLSKLEKLFLDHNYLEGTLSNQILSNLSRLSYMSISGNSKIGVNIDANWIPPFQLAAIGLASCKLGPYFPKWLLTQKNLSYVDISNTGISDNMPLSFWNSLSSNLRYMNISNNNLHGELPDLAIAFDDEGLDMDLSSNKFQGAVPSFLGNARLLRLNGNQFSQATSFLCAKTKVFLQYLDLSDNVLTGKLPNCWGNFDSLQSLHLDNNYLSGNLPISISRLSKLEALHLRNNRISGKLTLALQNCTKLTVLDLSYNHLTGHIPHWTGNHFISLIVLSLRSNSFHGGIPLSLCELSNLQLIDLSSNNLFGFIPNCVYNFTSMIKNVDALPIETSFQSDFVSYDSVWIMWKRKEWSFGEILREVAAIDISNNKLEGPIPEQVSSLVRLVFLNFSSNRLNGSIPSKIGQLTSLQFLDFSNNQLCGEIPTSLSSVSSLEILDLSNNNLTGRIPTGTQLQGFDPSSYMGNPQLCGDPLPKCPGEQPPINARKEVDTTHEDESDHDDYFFLGLIISMVLGFISGFWGVRGTLVIKRSWIAYFHLLKT